MTDWTNIVEHYGGVVWATACRLLGNSADASDCYQETFLEAIKISRTEPVRNWSALLRHLATARSLDLMRVRQPVDVRPLLAPWYYPAKGAPGKQVGLLPALESGEVFDLGEIEASAGK